MEENNRFIVGGYRFGSAQDAQKAQQELKQIEYLDQKIEGKPIRKVLQAYDKILDDKMFATPIGWEYLCRLQTYLKENGIPEVNIRPVPMYMTFYHLETEAESAFVRQRIRPSRKINPYQKQARISIIINIFLAVLVIAMFAIALNSRHPNILNYKKNILDQYSSWEQDLTEREKEVREKEAELIETYGEKWEQGQTE